MISYLIDEAVVNYYKVTIKFGRTVKISSLKNENFKLYQDLATPAQVSAPFADINTIKDYNQISRTLTLYWRVTLQDQMDYYIDLVNLVDSSGVVVDNEQVHFTYVSSSTPSTMPFSEPVIQEVLIEDKSIKKNIDITYDILAKNPKFYVDSVVPENGDFYLDNSFNDGRVIITFNERPATNFLNSKYFKAQKKKIQRSPSRWEDVAVQVSMHSWRPEVYIDFPSSDATPVYNTSEKEYFESGFKYKIILSKEIGI